MTEYVNTADALFFHKQLIERYGGAPGVRDPGALESALHRPQTGYYDTIIHEAAALLESLVQNHPFMDGNKRVAFAVTDVFLRINGFRICGRSEAIYDFLIKLLEQGIFDMEHLVPWLQTNVMALENDKQPGSNPNRLNET
jgi:death on curing protein